MTFRKIFAYLMIITGIVLEFFNFTLCSKAMCYFLGRCTGELGIEFLSAFFVAELLLIVGGLYTLRSDTDKRYL